MTTLVIDEGNLERESIDLSGGAFHHLFRVRRLRVGDQLRVVDGRGRARSAVVERVDRHSASLSLGATVSSNEPELQVELLVASPRPQRASWLVEKSTEIGIAAVRFINSNRGPRNYGSSTLDRLRRVARAAVEQSGRATIPEISSGHGWEEVPALLSRLDRCWVLDLGRRPARLAVADSWHRVGCVVGPEGGWEGGEIRNLVDAGCIVAGLGERVLRVETAAIVAASALLVTPSVDSV